MEMRSKISKTGCLASVLALSIFPLVTATNAATVWIGADGADLGLATNWDNGLPSAGNPGTFNAGTYSVIVNTTDTSGWGTVTQNGGTIVSNVTNNLNIRGGVVWNLNSGGNITSASANMQVNGTLNVNTGGILNPGGRITVSSPTGILNLNGGTWSGGGVWAAHASAVYNLNSGTFNPGYVLARLGTLNYYAGTTGTTSTIVIGNSAVATAESFNWNHYGGSFTGASFELWDSSTLNSTGGSITINTALTLNDASKITFGLGNGVVSAASLATSGTLGSSYINFLSGTNGKLTIGGYVLANFESLWDTGWLYLDGTNKTSHGGITFAAAGFQVTGNTLSIVPEPSTWALLAGCLSAAVVLRRRKR